MASSAFDAWLEETTTGSLAALRADGRKIVLLEPIPEAADEADPLACLSEETWMEACRYVANPGPPAVERIYRRLAQEDDALWPIDLDLLVCPYFPICDPIVDDEVVKIDPDHLSRAFAESLAPAMRGHLEQRRILG